MEVGLGPGHSVLDDDPSPRQGAQQLPQFSVHVYCGQTAGLIKMPLGTKVGFGPGHIVLDGDSAAPRKGVQQPHHFSAHVYCDQTVAHLGNC